MTDISFDQGSTTERLARRYAAAAYGLGGRLHRRRDVADPALEQDLVEGQLVG